jgi:hypothetical protein
MLRGGSEPFRRRSTRGHQPQPPALDFGYGDRSEHAISTGIAEIADLLASDVASARRPTFMTGG